jgi:hypothetical protein
VISTDKVSMRLDLSTFQLNVPIRVDWVPTLGLFFLSPLVKLRYES